MIRLTIPMMTVAMLTQFAFTQVCNFAPDDDFLPGEWSRMLGGDFDNDGLEDLALVPRDEVRIDIYRQTIDREFVFDRVISENHGYVSFFDLHAADINNDTFLDLLTCSAVDNILAVFLSNNDGSYSEPMELTLTHNPHIVRTGDLDGDGDLDIFAGTYSSPGLVYVFLNDGKGSFDEPAIYETRSFVEHMRARDLDADGDLDLVVVTRLFPGEVCILINQGDGTFVELDECISVGTGPDGLIVEDLNADGILDIATANQFTNDITVLYGLGGMQYEPAMSIPLGASGDILIPIDIDRDGDIDLIAPIPQINKINILLNDETGKFSQNIIISGGKLPRDVVT